jgi:hypothetical protein
METFILIRLIRTYPLDWRSCTGTSSSATKTRFLLHLQHQIMLPKHIRSSQVTIEPTRTFCRNASWSPELSKVSTRISSSKPYYFMILQLLPLIHVIPTCFIEFPFHLKQKMNILWIVSKYDNTSTITLDGLDTCTIKNSFQQFRKKSMLYDPSYEYIHKFTNMNIWTHYFRLWLQCGSEQLRFFFLRSGPNVSCGHKMRSSPWNPSVSAFLVESIGMQFKRRTLGWQTWQQVEYDSLFLFLE